MLSIQIKMTLVFLKKINVSSFQIFSLSVKSRIPFVLEDDDMVTYRIYSIDSQIVPHKSLCLLWNQAAERYISDSL